MVPERPPDEARRQRVLRSYAVLDTPPEPAFDELARLAASLCEAPIGVVSLTDGDRQWFKASVGLGGAQEVARDISFCGHCILGEEPLVVPDAALDPRFADNPLVLGPPHLRFYAGYPLRGGDGAALGTLCVLDVRPRGLPSAHLDALGVLARAVMANLELRRSLASLTRAEQEQRRLASDLAQAVGRLTRLNGLLPMCAWCQKVRNEEQRTWQPLDEYVTSHSRITHGICPDCARQEIARHPRPTGPGAEPEPQPEPGLAAWKPAHEAERLAALAESGLGGSLPEKAFDDLTRLAADLCHTPMAALNLVEEDRLWAKAAIGLPGRELPRTVGICAWTILDDRPLVVADLAEDVHFRENPLLVDGRALRFYAGVPVRTADGHNVGALCVLDTVPRELETGQLEALKALAQQAAVQVDVRRSLGAVARGTTREPAALLRDAPLPVWIEHPETRAVLEVSRAGETLLGRSREEIVGRPAGPVRVVASGSLPEARVVVGAPLLPSPQALHGQRLETVGQLAANVAHDFANLLTLILGHADWLAAGEPSRAAMRDGLEQISRAGQRATTLVRRLLDFTRADDNEPVVLELGPFLEGLRRTLLRLTREDVALTVGVGPELGRVRIDPTRLEQVLLNLFSNALDALPRGGAIAIRAEAAAAGHGPVVRITVADSGIGMDEQTRARLFRPFFTTKPVGRGTGLGLSAVYGIVHQAGGTLDVESAPGRGTLVRIELPASCGDPAAPGGPVQDSLLGDEMVLLVEDDPAVRKVLAAGLKRYGYRVFVAGAPSTAFKVARGQRGIRLLITDVVMPQMSGEKLSEHLQRRLPGLATLYVSGYADEIARLGQAGKVVLPKPLRIADLARRMREVLDRGGRDSQAIAGPATGGRGPGAPLLPEVEPEAEPEVVER